MKMISFRGLLGPAVGVAFLWFAIRPADFGDDIPPVFVAAILVLAGLGCIAMGLLSLRFVYTRGRLLRSVNPVAAEVIIDVDDGSDSSAYALDVRYAGERWAVGAGGGKAIKSHEAGVVHRAEVWPDPGTGAPVAIAINGLQVNTLPTPRRVPR